jgi:4-diphosphocytidyl-2-C-methyl-D-erythritol kinase
LKISREAPAKINLSLDITGRRQDGYHLVRMIMQTVSLFDVIEIENVENNSKKEPGDIILHCDDPKVPTDDRNLCVRAARLMQRTYAIKDGFIINLEKHIPSSAGLAGGSTDAATVMLMIRDLLRPGITDEDLRAAVVSLGADIPYCIMKGTALSEGIGEILTPLRPIKRTNVILIKPDVDISTQTAYGNFDTASYIEHPDTEALLDALYKDDMDMFSEHMGNVLEYVSAGEYPIIYELKKELRERGAFASMMSGSGSTVFGLYRDEEKASEAYDFFKEKYSGFQIFLTETV